MSQKLAPVALFTYKRPDHTRRTVEALAANQGANEIELFIFSDGPRSEKDERDVLATRQLCRDFKAFSKIHVREAQTNQGLAKSIIAGVSEMTDSKGQVIVLEDDMVTSRTFLQYMQTGLERYVNQENVVSLHGYCYPISNLPSSFFLRGADCWGWATWKRGWQHFNPNGEFLLQELEKHRLTDDFDFDGTFPYTQMLRDQIAGRVDSWAIRWYASAFLKGLVTLYPGQSLVQNIGLDGSGTHSQTDKSLIANPIDYFPELPIEARENGMARKKFSEYFYTSLPLKKRLLLKMQKLIR